MLKLFRLRWIFIRSLVKKLKLVINSLGDKESRIAHREALINHFKPRIDEFCGTAKTGLRKIH